jgi:hypothetical protein
MSRRRHAKPAIEEALRFAEARGWRVEEGGSHAWGQMYCPYNSRECRCGMHCISSIWSTPKNPGNHAKRLMRAVENCIGANILGLNKK